MFDSTPFARALAKHNGIISLMDDLGDALNNPNRIALGGGNPAILKEVNTLQQRWLRDLTADEKRLQKALNEYSGPAGHHGFRDAYAAYLNQHFGWSISAENIVLTNGSQSAFFLLFNALATPQKPIYCPLSPEYIGYRDLGVERDLLLAPAPVPVNDDGVFFNYAIDPGDDLPLGSVSAIALSTPCNPTGRVTTNAELTALNTNAMRLNIPLIIDCAYGAPAPNLVSQTTKLPWFDSAIYCFSLSKLGFPGARTGIVVTSKPTARLLSNINARLCLAPNNFAPALLEPAFRNHEIDAMCNDILKPYYRDIREFSTQAIQKGIRDLPVRIHRAEGGFFLWLWCDQLPIDDQTLYEKLRDNGVVIVPGRYFFPHSSANHAHARSCIRISLGATKPIIERGLAIINQVLNTVYQS